MPALSPKTEARIAKTSKVCIGLIVFESKHKHNFIAYRDMLSRGCKLSHDMVMFQRICNQLNKQQNDFENVAIVMDEYSKLNDQLFQYHAEFHMLLKAVIADKNKLLSFVASIKDTMPRIAEQTKDIFSKYKDLINRLSTRIAYIPDHLVIANIISTWQVKTIDGQIIVD